MSYCTNETRTWPRSWTNSMKWESFISLSSYSLVLLCPGLLCPVVLCAIVISPALCYPAFPCPALPNPIISYPNLSCLTQYCSLSITLTLTLKLKLKHSVSYTLTMHTTYHPPSDPRARTLGAANCTGCDMRLAGAHRKGSGWIVANAVTSSVRSVLTQEKMIWYLICIMIHIYDIVHELTIWTYD